MESIWTRDVIMPQFSAVKRDMKVDVLIIGGGMTGLLCGYFLKDRGAKYAIVEKDSITSGVTRNTTAKITAYHPLIYSKLAKNFGMETAKTYLQANTDAVSRYRQMAQSIDCSFQEKDHYIYTMHHQADLLEEASVIEKIGGRVEYTEHVGIPLAARCALKASGQAQFHPLRFAAKIAEGQDVYENSFAGDIRKERYGYQVSIRDSEGKMFHINADRVIVATHFPYIDRFGMYFLKMYQQRSYVLALEAEKGETLQLGSMYNGCGVEDDNPLNLSFRSYGNYLLLGGGGGRTGKKNPSYESLRKQASSFLPDYREAAAWAAQDCMTLDGLPYIGEYAKGKDGLLTATGFQKWGMTGAMTAALSLTGELDKELSGIFKPRRTLLRKQLFINGFESAVNMLRPTAPRCTHLGCALRWNKAEKTWDCGCHGSRFTEDGKVIDGPAQNDLKR